MQMEWFVIMRCVQQSITFLAFFTSNEDFIKKLEQNNAKNQKIETAIWHRVAQQHLLSWCSCMYDLSHSMPFTHGERSHLGNLHSQSLIYSTIHCISSWNGINQYRQEHSEQKVLLSNPKWSENLNSLAFCPVLFKPFKESLILDVKGWECYKLLHTPQCDKPCHLHIERGRTCVFSLYFTPQSIVPKQFCLRRILKKCTWSWNWIIQYMQKDIVEQHQMKWQSYSAGFLHYFVQAFQWNLDFWWERPGMLWTVAHATMW